MLDNAADSALTAIYGKLIAFGLTIIISVLGALFTAYKWLFHRQISRIDKNDESIDDLDKSHAILAMQINVVQQSVDTQEARHKEEMEGHRRETDRRVEAVEKAFEKQISLLTTYLEKLVEQGERRRKEDN